MYYSPKTGFRSAKHLWELAKEEDKDITEKEVKQWLEHQETFSKYKSFNSPSFFRHTMVRYLGEQMQIDLVFLNNHNDRGYHIILNAIEILSRFAFSKPLKTRSGKEVLEQLKIILEEFKERFHQFPKLIQADEGGEFRSKEFINFLKEKDIHFFTSFSARKATIVERFNRTMKEKIKKLHNSRKSHEWIDDLPDIVQNYNTQEHRSLGMAPADVNFSNEALVWTRLYGHVMNVKKPKFSVGDKVRVLHFSLYKQKEEFVKYFEKKYPPKISSVTGKKSKYHAVKPKSEAPFSEEVFTIDKVLMGDPVVYKLFSEEEGIEIMGKFYEQELSLFRD